MRIALVISVALNLLLAWLSGYLVYRQIRIALSCDTTVSDILPSGFDRNIVVFYEVNCGVGSPPNTQLAIISSPLDLDLLDGSDFLSVKRPAKIEARWISKGELEVEILSSADIYHKADESNGVHITYK